MSPNDRLSEIDERIKQIEDYNFNDLDEDEYDIWDDEYFWDNEEE